MTPEARLERLERVATLLVRVGYRAREQFRNELREHERMLKHAFDLQIANEEKFGRNEERFSRNEARFVRNEKRFAKLVASQVDTDRRLNCLIEIIKEERNRGSRHDDEHQ